MLKTLWGWVKGLFWIELDEDVPDNVIELPHYNVPDEWPFAGPEPTQLAVHLLNTGMVSRGDHIFWYPEDSEKARSLIETPNGSWPVKMLVWWISGAEVQRGAASVTATCGERHCARPDHLKVNYGTAPGNSKDSEPVFELREAPAPKVEGVKAVPKPKPKADYSLLSGDRTICVSSKVYFPSKNKCDKARTEFNNKIRKPNGRKLYTYKCDWCSGWHLTKQNPKTRKQYKHPGSWVS